MRAFSAGRRIICTEPSSRGRTQVASFTTHYENRKVARDPPPDVIRAAYQTRFQHYHTDRNPGTTTPARITPLITARSQVLSSPVNRNAPNHQTQPPDYTCS